MRPEAPLLQAELGLQLTTMNRLREDSCDSCQIGIHIMCAEEFLRLDADQSVPLESLPQT